MKRFLTGVFLVALALSAPVALRAQSEEFVAPKKKVKVEQKTTVKPSPVELNGVVVQTYKAKKPLQMINPLAPKEYGNGVQNLSRDPNDPRADPQGFVLLGLQW